MTNVCDGCVWLGLLVFHDFVVVVVVVYCTDSAGVEYSGWASGGYGVDGEAPSVGRSPVSGRRFLGRIGCHQHGHHHKYCRIY